MRIHTHCAAALLLAAAPLATSAQTDTASTAGSSEWSYAGPTAPEFCRR